MLIMPRALWPIVSDCHLPVNKFMEEAKKMIEHNKKAYKTLEFPNATGSTSPPPEIFEPSNQ